MTIGLKDDMAEFDNQPQERDFENLQFINKIGGIRMHDVL
jgi:hypothetical protein